MAGTSMSGGAGAGAAAATFDGVLTEWPENSLNVCNVPTDEKAFVRYIAAEWYKNQSIDNPRAQAQQAVQNAKVLYNQLKSFGYMD